MTQLEDSDDDEANVQTEEKVVLWRKASMIDNDIANLKHQFNLLQYAESEGPTKADNGEADDLVLRRANWGAIGWTNPLEWKDDGSGDELVVGPVV